MTADVSCLRLLLVSFAGWINRRQQQDVIEYLVEENHVLREQLKGQRLRLTDDQRRLILFGERVCARLSTSLWRTYHGERNHQGLGNELIAPQCGQNGGTHLHCRERLGGLLRYCYRAT
jgi:hypothetical protein